eukprot:4023402-Ditylum_brightwellii.AAC.1
MWREESGGKLSHGHDTTLLGGAHLILHLSVPQNSHQGTNRSIFLRYLPTVPSVLLQAEQA